jgi:hypothetical protein
LLALGSSWTRAKAERIDRGEQLPASGVLLPQLGVLLPQLLGFSLDLLDIVRELLHPLFVPHLALLELQHALLVIGIPTPIQHRQQLSPARQR